MQTKRSSHFKGDASYAVILLVLLYVAGSGYWIYSTYHDWTIWLLNTGTAVGLTAIYLVMLKRQLHDKEAIHKRTAERIKQMAYYDDLTGLPNRRKFRDKLDLVVQKTDVSVPSQGEMLAVFYMDVDRFKWVNESLGHDFGDMLLLQVAERLTHCVGEDDFVARMEGDEFALFYQHLHANEHAFEKAQEILSALDQGFYLQDRSIHITASIGVSIYMGDATTEVLMKQADLALSRAKEQGRNNVQFYHSNLNYRSIERLNLEGELRMALHQNQFELYYQPQMDIRGGDIVGMEALIRWRHPERGMVSPGTFIPLAEETGFIVEIGEWVIREACRQNRQWQENGFPKIPVSVNLSVRQFLQQNLKQKVANILKETGLEPQYLALEITESMTLDVDYATNCLIELKSLGLLINMDDFGTGYSSLSYLKKFPINKLKIDRSFVRDLMEDPSDAAIVSTIISMAHHMKLKVIAEGVETIEQLDYLNANHCNEVQGFYFSPPLPADEFVEKVKAITESAAM
ncbi:putative bifunctional diguanylate cyclase/phosphodiesterase [Marinicrinis sediminis]|uniref:Bifunctional diguanylate cyclase/phosphodiesterase n=1 Tax=Marinicrinis sediminis TaxID=1652465 RepID=A0ABW5R8T7_9BACL